MPFIEAPTAFYLGRTFEPENGKLGDEVVYYDSRDLTTHAIVMGMTGSGKTGLCLNILQEAILDNVPAIIIDPKGDVTNLALTFPQLSPQDFQSWVHPDDARRAGLDMGTYAQDVAQQWRDGLANWSITPERLQALKSAAEISIYTPGSDAGLPVNILNSLHAPQENWQHYAESIRERINGIVNALFALARLRYQSVQDMEHVLVSNIIEYNWRQAKDLTLEELILQIQTPPFDRLGVLPIEQVMSKRKRNKLALDLNNTLMAADFQSWLQGQPLNIQSLLYQPNGRPRVSIFYTAHLNEQERLFFTTLLLESLISWMRNLSGTTALRAILYIDEVFGYFPPYPKNPPTKEPLLRLLKQARAFGIGLLLATQSPADLDYKGLSNAGTWFIGRLQTENDRKKVLAGLQSISNINDIDMASVERILPDLQPRTFLMHNVHNQINPIIMHTRWSMNYLAGPLTRQQIGWLMQEQKQRLAVPAPGEQTQEVETPTDIVAWLNIHKPDGSIERFPFDATLSGVTIGRLRSNEIFLSSPKVSRRHTNIVYRNQQLLVTDMDSASGTYLNGQLVERQQTIPLADSDELVIADYRIVVEFVEPVQTVQEYARAVQQQATVANTSTQRRYIPNIRVFLSSPGDVQAEREIAFEVVNNLHQQPTLRNRVDIRIVAWDGPDADAPMIATFTPAEAINMGMPKPSECDIFVAIFWSRMGIPFRDADGVEYLSGTHYELMSALQSNRTKSIIYRRIDDTPFKINDPDVESKFEQYQRVKDFFESDLFINDGVIQRGVNIYKSVEDLGEMLPVDLEGLVLDILQKHTAILHDLFSQLVTEGLIDGSVIFETIPYPQSALPTTKEIIDGLIHQGFLMRQTSEKEDVIEIADENLVRDWQDLADWIAEKREISQVETSNVVPQDIDSTAQSLYLGVGLEDDLWVTGEEYRMTLHLSSQGARGLYPVAVPTDAQDVTLVLRSQNLKLYGDVRYTINLNGLTRQTRTISAYSTFPGNAALYVDVYVDGQRVDTVKQGLTVIVDPDRVREVLALPNPAKAADPDAQQADLSLRFVLLPLDKAGTQVRLSVQAFSELPYLQAQLPGQSLGYRDIPVALIDNIQAQMERLTSGYVAPNIATAYLREIGKLLWQEFFPKRLRQLYNDIANPTIGLGVRSILLITDDDCWLPYELAMPRDKAWCEAFQMTRWVEGLGQARRTVFPLGLIHVTQEADVSAVLPEFGSLDWGENRGMLTPQTHTNLRDERVQGYHFVRAGGDLRGQATQLALRDADTDMETYLRENSPPIQERSPLVSVATVSNYPVPVGYELLLKWISAGASAVVGTHWSVSPTDDRIFWRVFYQHLHSGALLGEALMLARQAVKAASPNPLAYLAYYAIGDPMASGYLLVDGMGNIEVTAAEMGLNLSQLETGKIYTLLATLRREPALHDAGRRCRLRQWATPPVQLTVDAPRCKIVRQPKIIGEVRQTVTWSFEIEPTEAGNTVLFLDIHTEAGEPFAATCKIDLKIQRPLIVPPPQQKVVFVDFTDKQDYYHINSERYAYRHQRPSIRDIRRLYEDTLEQLTVAPSTDIAKSVMTTIERMMEYEWWHALTPQSTVTVIDNDHSLPWELAAYGQDYWGTRFSMGHLPQVWRNTAVSTQGRVLTVISAHSVPDYLQTLAGKIEIKDARQHLPPHSLLKPDAAAAFLGSIQVHSRANILHVQGTVSADLLTVPITDTLALTFEQQAKPIYPTLPLRGKPLVYLAVTSADGQSHSCAPFALQFLAMGAGAVIAPIGTLSEQVNDSFAHAFYQVLLQPGKPTDAIGSTLMQARMRYLTHTQDMRGLSYALFGDPNSQMCINDTNVS